MKMEYLKEYIRQEVKKAVKDELKEYLFESIIQKKETTVTTSSSTVTESSENVKSDSEVESSKPKKFVKYTKNDALNKVLNETVGGVPREGSFVGLMGGDFDSKPLEQINEVKVPETAPEPVKNVVNAMNRDYRSLLKAVDKKRSGKV